jgi:L-ascorbate metabolism protein UlaG (beta-lactamase superfamily)
MKINKLGHCCLLIEEGNLRLLTDPGEWTTAQNDVQKLNVILITHEHRDHFHIESLKKIQANNPEVRIFTNQGVGKILEQESLSYELLEHGQNTVIEDVLIEGYGEKHAVIYPEVPSVINTGYLIANRFFYPGDAFSIPEKPVEILALPVAGPWMKISEAIDYGRALKPKVSFPVHDGMLKIFTATHRWPQKFLEEVGVKFIIPEEGKAMEF